MRPLAKRVEGNLPRVRIPVSPLQAENPRVRPGVFSCRESPPERASPRPAYNAAMILRRCALLLCLVASACAGHRELVIESNPPGARVFMDREDLGRTPVRTAFEYGGVRDFLLLHEEGDTKYAPVRVRQDTSEFFLDQFPFDLLARLTPFETEQEVRISVDLEPSNLVDLVMTDEEGYVKALLDRAEAMRTRARRAQDEGEPAAPPFIEAEDGRPVSDEEFVDEPIEKPTEKP